MMFGNSCYDVLQYGCSLQRRTRMPSREGGRVRANAARVLRNVYTTVSFLKVLP